MLENKSIEESIRNISDWNITVLSPPLHQLHGGQDDHPAFSVWQNLFVSSKHTTLLSIIEDYVNIYSQSHAIKDHQEKVPYV